MSTRARNVARQSAHPDTPRGSSATLETGRDCAEEAAARARERTNALVTGARWRSPDPGPARCAYAARELERIARGLRGRARALQGHHEDEAARYLERTADDLSALSQAMTLGRGG